MMVLGTNRATRNLRLPQSLKIDDTPLEIVPKYKYLGLQLNSTLTLTDNVTQTIGTVSSKLNTLTHIKKYVHNSTLLTVYKSAILPIIEYGNITNSLINKTQYKKIQRLQNRALNIIYNNDHSLSLEDKHIKAKLPTVAQRADRQLLCLMYRRSWQPDIYPQISSAINTRGNSKIHFNIPRPTIERFKNFPLYKGAQLWDALPASTQKAVTYDMFKACLSRTIDFERYPITG